MILLELFDSIWIATTGPNRQFKRAWLFKTLNEANRAARQEVGDSGGYYFPIEKAGERWLMFETATANAPRVWAYGLSKEAAIKAGEAAVKARGFTPGQVDVKHVKLSPWEWKDDDEAD